MNYFYTEETLIEKLVSELGGVDALFFWVKLIMLLFSMIALIVTTIIALKKESVSIMETERERSKKDKSLLLITFISLGLFLLTPMFRLIKVSVFGEDYKCNGFSFLKKDFVLMEFVDRETVSGLLTFLIMMILMLTVGAILLIRLIIKCRKGKIVSRKDMTVTTIVAGGLVCLYMIFGLAVKSVVKEYIDGFGTVSTSAYIPFILQVLVLIGYFVCLYCMDDNMSAVSVLIEKLSAGAKTTEGETIKEIKMYKELLDNQIITQEEFDEKKTMLLSKK